jgi:tetratricopeptide (TPR) repeat protein
MVDWPILFRGHNAIATERPGRRPLSNSIARLCVYLFLCGSMSAQSAPDLASRAGDAMKAGDYASAEKLFSKLIAAEPEIAEAYSNLGFAQYYEQKMEPAKQSFKKALSLKPGLFVPNFYLAKINAEAGKYNEALPLIRKAVSLQPIEPASQALLAEVLSETGFTAEAITHYQELRRQQPRDTAIQYQLAHSYLEESHRLALLLKSSHPAFVTLLKAESDSMLPEWQAAALEEWNKALEDLRAIPGLRLAFADFLLRTHHVAEAETVLREELKIDPFSYRAELALGEVSELKGDHGDAIEHFNRSVQVRPEFYAPLPHFSLLAEHPEGGIAALRPRPDEVDFGSAFLAAELADKVGSSEDVARWREIAEIKRDAIQIRLKSHACEKTPPSMASERRVLGMKCLREKRLEQGLRLLMPIAKSHPLDSDLRTAMARALLEDGRYDQVAVLLGSSSVREPENAFMLASSYKTLASRELENLAKNDPLSVDLQKLVAESLSDRQMYKEAAEQYRNALNIEPNDPGLYFALGEAYFNQMQFEDAEQAYAHAIALRPSDPASYVMRASALVELNRPEEAISLTTKALELDPKLLQAHVSRGRALALAGRNEEAAQELEKAASTDTDGTLHYGLLKLYKKLGRTEDAKRALRVWEELHSRASASSEDNSGPVPAENSHRE